MREIESGLVYFNAPTTGAEIHLPFGGMKASGNGHRELGMSAGAVKVAVHRLRRRYREELRQRVADTVDTNQEVEDEIRYLLKTLGPAG